MARGAPDDSNVLSGETVYRLDDMGELAARLGSPVAYNRAGLVLFMDTFEDGLAAWTQASPGLGGHVWPANTKSWQGGLAAELISGTGAMAHASIAKYQPPIAPTNIGTHAVFALDAALHMFEVQVTVGDGVNRYYFFIRYDPPPGLLSYRTGLVAYTQFAICGTLFSDANNWHNLKLVVDSSLYQHVRFYLDNIEYSMAGMVPYFDNVAHRPFTEVCIKVWGDGFVSTTFYIDNVVLTFDEFA